MITSLPRLQRSLRLHGWIPMIVDGRSTHWRRIPCRIHPETGLRLGFLALAPSAPKFFAFGRDAARRLPSARVSRLRLCFVLPAVTDIVSWLSPEYVGLNQHGQGSRPHIPVSVVFRQHQCRLSNGANWFRLSAFFFWLGHLTLLAGDFVPGFQDLRHALVHSGCWFKPTPGMKRPVSSRSCR